MANKKISFDDVKDFIFTLPYNEFRKIVKQYSTHSKTSFEKEMNDLITLSFQQKLESLGINKACHRCGSLMIVKNGKRPNSIQEYKCKDCNTKFTLFSNTILEKTNWHWDIWVVVLQMTINGFSIDSMINVLEGDYGCNGINRKTVWLLRMKLIHALASIDMPVLTGIVQVDETFIRESQKGSRKLVNYVGLKYNRKPRYGSMPSKLGVMGPEFATLTTAIDDRGYCVCKVSSLGKLTKELFVDLFEKHINNPAYICSDANDVYENHCELFDIPHYVKPSNYDKTIKQYGYESADESNPVQAAITRDNNENLFKRLYDNELIDKITNRGIMSYEEFIQLKRSNSLNLGRVNELHSDIKKFINRDMTNVSTKYLQDYIGFFTYKRNWRVKNGRYPNSIKDTEKIFIEILKTKVNYTIIDVKNQELNLPKPTNRYITLLDENTRKARIATSNQYFKFDEEDGVKSFNKRNYLINQPKSKLYAICKECKLTKYRKLALWSLVSLILEQPNIDNIIYNLLSNDRQYKISDEDLEAIRAEGFKH